MKPVTLIIPTYNDISNLKLVLASAERQTYKNFEVVISDDGSKPEIVEQIESYLKTVDLEVRHIWHEDKGFRKTIIYNRAIDISRGEYIIFNDGDCIMHRKFIEEHYKQRDPKLILTGRRVNLSQNYSEKLTPDLVRRGEVERNLFRVFRDSILRKASYPETGIYLKSEVLRKYLNQKPKGLLGSNMSLSKENLIKVNGFDERYMAYGFEESDLQHRLKIAGIKVKTLRNIAIQYHLYHPAKMIPSENFNLFEEVKKQNYYYTPYGMKK
jgi:glycosyltransferase involved in cell wall biosynthesis